MNNAFTIRRARRGDAERLGRLWKRLLDEQAALDARLSIAADALKRWHNDFPVWLEDETQRLFVAAREESGLIGFAAVARWGPPPIYESAAEAYVSELYVVPEARRQGVGTALVDAVRRWAEETGSERLRLRVLAANEDARAFWECAGAAPLATTLTIDLPPGGAPSKRGGAAPERFGFG